MNSLNAPEVDYDYLFKMIIIGNPGVGKSSLLLRFVDDKFADQYNSTIGVDFKIKTVEIDNKNVKLQIWDTAGQERFRTITSSYYKGAHGIVLCYDVTDRDSFNDLNMWMNEVDKNGSETSNRLIVGNKCDSQDQRIVSYEEGKDLAEHYGCKFIETSAKNTTNVFESFVSLAREIKSRIVHVNPGHKNSGNKRLSKSSATKVTSGGKKKCC